MLQVMHMEGASGDAAEVQPELVEFQVKEVILLACIT